MKSNMQKRAEEQQQALALLNQKQWLAGHENISLSFNLATETAATILNTQRVSVWLYKDNKSSIECMDLFIQDPHDQDPHNQNPHNQKKYSHESGLTLSSSDYPIYFEALAKERIIAADDAHTNEHTAEFSEHYLTSLNISSMLDAPIKLGGKAVGVLCCEHVGPPRTWEIDEKIFAASVADFCSIALELAEHKKTSDELRKHKNELESLISERTKELEIKNKELEDFNFTLSHDLRGPLRHVNGYLEIIEEDCSKKLNSTEKDYIKRTRTCVITMYDMIDAILNLSKISAQALDKTPINLSSLMREISNQLIIKRQVKLTIQDSLDACGDKELLRIALTNLLENALKYSAKSKPPLIEFGSTQENNKTIFFIRDNGCGFDMHYSHKLFDAFQRLHNDSEYKGSGVGLSTVHKVIQRHGGDIWAEAEVNNGACFYFTLD